MIKVKGHVATVYHAGTASYYEATLIRKVSRQEMIAVNKAAAGEDPRQDGSIFKDVIARVMKKRPTVYNDLNTDRTKRRLKASFLFPNADQLTALSAEMKRQFGDRLLDVGVTREINTTVSRYTSGGGEFFVRLTAF